MIKEFFMKQMLKKQGVPSEQIDTVIKIVNKNPQLFTQIAEEVKEEMERTGKDQMAVTMEVMMRHKAELEQLKD